jgi:hypothetical protein
MTSGYTPSCLNIDTKFATSYGPFINGVAVKHITFNALSCHKKQEPRHENNTWKWPKELKGVVEHRV